jgi:signal peptidase I
VPSPLAHLPRPWRIAADWAVTLIVAIGVVLTVKVEVANPYRIPTSSMEPTLHCAKPGSGCAARFSDRVLANRFIYRFRDPRRGEIVVFKLPRTTSCGEQGDIFVKRMIGLPGQVVSERDGQVYVDGKPLNEPYVQPARRDRQTNTWRPVPKGQYFVMGDNRSSSCDSRTWGTVPRSDLIGPVFLTYWPPYRVSVR